MTVRVLVGDALSVLRTLPDASVQMVCTSPPYFGLRSYSTAPQVWGGEEHEHTFGEDLPGRKTISRPDHSNGVMLGTRGVNGGTAARGLDTTSGAFCPCGAWRGELGSEPTPALFIEHLLLIFDEVKRVLRLDGLCFVNIGDSYSGSGKGPTGHNGLQNAEKRQGFEAGYIMANGERSKGGRKSKTEGVGGIPAKNLLLIPQRFAIGMVDRGWICRSAIVWAKTSAMPESVRDRPTSAWEPIWMFSKSQRYFYDADAVRQPHADDRPKNPIRPEDRWDWGKPNRGVNRETPAGNMGVLGNPAGANLRNVWLLGPEPSRDEHYAAFVTEIPKRCILAGTSEKGACPACGAGWVRVVERQTGFRGPAIVDARRNDVLVPGNTSQFRDGHDVRRGVTSHRVDLGWSPGCTCPPADPVPQVVLDPFLGSGTTALVADRLGRDAIGIELSPTYASMAKAKIEADAGTLFGESVAVEAPRQVGLFDEAAG